jgi:2-desacetyl-2-hydroxyethyl bacteriochlorophyllide A dehydrogenase
MRAVVIEGPGDFRVDTAPDPSPAPDEVIVEVGACGICGTDLHIIDGEFPPTTYPIIPGHEFAGRIVAAGSEVTELAEGTRVAVDPSLFCGHCDYCRIARGNLCRNWGAIGDTVNGAFAEYVAVPAANAYLLPDDFDLRYGAMVEPLSCAVHGINMMGDLLGRRCLVIGAGTMGLLIGQLLRHAGATEVALVDRNKDRLAITETLGLGPTASDARELPSPGFDVAVDATGVPRAIEAAFDALGRGGILLVFGVAAAGDKIALSPFRIYNDEIRIIGSMAVLHSFGTARDLLTARAIDVAPLLSDPYPMYHFADAVESVRTGSGVGTKVQVSPKAVTSG